jgi:hypothetical protein
MAAAVVASNAPARPGGVMASAALIPITITLVTTAYATGSAGFSFDIATVLNNAGPLDSGVNPADVYMFIGGAATGYRADQFLVGTATYNTTTDSSFRTKMSLATCPCTMRLWNGITEIADGNITQTITGVLVAMRGGGLNP